MNKKKWDGAHYNTAITKISSLNANNFACCRIHSNFLAELKDRFTFRVSKHAPNTFCAWNTQIWTINNNINMARRWGFPNPLTISLLGFPKYLNVPWISNYIWHRRNLFFSLCLYPSCQIETIQFNTHILIESILLKNNLIPKSPNVPISAGNAICHIRCLSPLVNILRQTSKLMVISQPQQSSCPKALPL